MRGEGVELAETEGFGPRVGERVCFEKARSDATRRGRRASRPHGPSAESCPMRRILRAVDARGSAALRWSLKAVREELYSSYKPTKLDPNCSKNPTSFSVGPTMPLVAPAIQLAATPSPRRVRGSAVGRAMEA